MVGLGSRVDSGWRQASSKDKRSQRTKTEGCSRGVEQEHMVMSRGNGGAKEVGDDS